jgi:hypothetical protein
MASTQTASAHAPTSACSGNYERHRPEETVLYRTLQAHWRTFLAEVRIVAAVMEATAIERILRHLGPEPRAPTLMPARPPPERDPGDEPLDDFVDDVSS